MVVNAMLLLCLYVYSNLLFYAIVYILVLRVGIYALTQETVAKCETFAAICATAV